MINYKNYIFFRFFMDPHKKTTDTLVQVVSQNTQYVIT